MVWMMTTWYSLSIRSPQVLLKSMDKGVTSQEELRAQSEQHRVGVFDRLPVDHSQFYFRLVWVMSRTSTAIL